MKIKMEIEFKLVEGEPVKPDGIMSAEDIVLDAFAYTIGRQNGAGDKAVRVTVVTDQDNETESVYEVNLVDA